MVVAIIGILAAVAIPVYNQYRTNAVQSTLTNSMNNVGKAYSACLTLNPFSRCDSLLELQVSCPDCDMANQGGTNGQFCAQASATIGGQSFTSCVESSGGVPAVIGSWPIDCSTITVNYGCTAAMTAPTAPPITCAGLGCSNTATVPAAAQCVAGNEVLTHSCTDTTNADAVTNPTSLRCDPSNGRCST